MKLVVKMPRGKKPFIGISFEDYFTAGKENQDLVNEHKHRKFKLSLEFIHKQLTVKIICEEALIVRYYNKVSYNEDILKRWFFLTKDCTDINFSQIYEKHGQDIVAKTFTGDKLFVLNIERYDVLDNQDNKPNNNVTGVWKDW